MNKNDVVCLWPHCSRRGPRLARTVHQDDPGRRPKMADLSFLVAALLGLGRNSAASGSGAQVRQHGGDRSAHRAHTAAKSNTGPFVGGEAAVTRQRR